MEAFEIKVIIWDKRYEYDYFMRFSLQNSLYQNI